MSGFGRQVMSEPGAERTIVAWWLGDRRIEEDVTGMTPAEFEAFEDEVFARLRAGEPGEPGEVDHGQA